MKEAFDWQTNSPCQHLRKCFKSSMENMHTNFRVERVKKQELFQVVVVFVILLTLMFDVLG